MKKYLHLLFVFLFVGSINNVTAQDSLNKKFAFEMKVIGGVSKFTLAKNNFAEEIPVPSRDLVIYPAYFDGVLA